MQQFVDRADELLSSLLEREAIAASTICGTPMCAKLGRWRCRDCTLAIPLCRGCMRTTHLHIPLHRIEYWVGTHFRAATLREVGCYLMVGHRDGVSHCESLRANAAALDLLEQRYDDLAALNDTEDPLLGGSETESDDDMSPEVYVTNPSESQFIDEILEEDEEVDDEDKWEFPTLQPLHRGGPGAKDSNAPSTEPFTSTKTSSQIPRQNDLRHNIVRIVHHNGIHHLALLTCACRGLENVCLDLMYRRLVVTSFVNHRTLFTADVLDYFRLVNLELKVCRLQQSGSNFDTS